MTEITYKALLIGNSTFQKDPHNLPALKGPPNDLRILEETLTHPQVGLHDPASVESLLDCTKSEIDERIDEFFASAKRTDQLLFYYSGHGRLDRFNNFYLCARDTRADRQVSLHYEQRRSSHDRCSCQGKGICLSSSQSQFFQHPGQMGHSRHWQLSIHWGGSTIPVHRGQHS